MTEGARRRWPLITLGVVLVALLAFAIGRFSTFPMVPGGPNAADAGFARDMQWHHSQAIEMAMIVYRDTEDEQLRRLSYDMAITQAGQRGEMYGWLVEWGLPQAGDPPMSWMSGTEHAHGSGEAPATEAEAREAMGMATEAEMAALREASGRTQACLFTALMIPHHRAAIEMTEAVRELGNDSRVRQVADAMAQSQRSEITAMERMRDRFGCAD